MKRPMINIALPRYGTRMLQAGEPFEASRRDAKALHALKKARYATEEDAPPVEAGLAAGSGTAPIESGLDDLAGLRADYQAKTGKRAYHGWDAGQLREKIAAAGAGED